MNFITENLKMAFEKGVKMCFLPENFAFMTNKVEELFTNAQAIDGPIIKEL